MTTPQVVAFPAPLGVRSRFWNTTIMFAARLGLPTGLLHRIRYGSAARHLKLGRGAYVLCDSLAVRGSVSLGRRSKILALDVRLGSHIRIDSDVQVFARSVVMDDNIIIDGSVEFGGMPLEQSRLEIGSGVWIFPHCVMNTTQGLTIGEGTGIGGYCLIWTHGSWQNYLDGFPVRFAPTRLGRNVWLPWHVIVMPGVTIGDNTTIAAGSVVVKDLPAHSFAAGTPAKVVKSGPDSWPGPQEKSRRDRLLEITRHFTAWYGRAFDDWRPLTLLAKSPTARFSSEEPAGEFRWEDDGSGGLVIVLAPPAAAGAAGAADRLFVLDDAEAPPIESASNWIDLRRGRYRLSSPRPLFRAYVAFLANYGVRLAHAETGLLNSLGVK